MRRAGLLLLVAILAVPTTWAESAPRQCQQLQSELNACQNSLASCQSSLTSVQSSLAAAQNSLALCQSQLAGRPPAPTVQPPASFNIAVGATVTTVVVTQLGVTDWRLIGPRDGLTRATGVWTVDGPQGHWEVTFTPDATGIGELRIVVTTATGVVEYPVVVTVH